MILKSIVLIFWTSVACAQQEPKPLIIREIIETLAADSLKGRMPGSGEIDVALDYIREVVADKAHLKSKIHHFTFELDEQHYQATNGYAFLNNYCDSTIVIGAHYDHIGMGGPLSKSIGTEGIHNGADDNASGVALALQLACQPELRQLKCNVLFVFYSGHELGLYGSKSFVDEVLLKKKKFKKVKAVINFDMIGRLSPIGKELYCASINYHGELPAAQDLKIKTTDPSVLERLDTKHFLALKVPAFNFTTGMHLDYHKVSDDAQYINYDGMEKTLDYLIRFLQQF